mgnify:CR=1 FL=1
MKIERKTVFRILLALIYCPVAAEVMVRLLDPVPMLPRYVRATESGIRGNQPDKTYWHRAAEYKVQMRTNSKGIRADYEIPYEKPRGTRRVLVLGDSFGMGYEVDLEDMFTTRMVHHLKEKHGFENVEVVNLSTSGHGNAEELIVLQNEGLKYDPDLVLLVWHSTDLADNVRSYLYEWKDGKLVRRNETYLPGVEINRKLHSIPLYPLIADNSQLYNLMRDWMGYSVKQWLVSIRTLSAREPQPEEEPKIDEVPYPEQLSVALLEEIRRVSLKNGARFLMLTVPKSVSRTEFISRFPEAAAAGTALSAVSPIERFRQAGGKKVYWEKGHGHWTPLGSDMVGEVLADQIAARRLLSGVEAPIEAGGF